MSYAIIRNANYKKENLSGLYKHNERKNTNYSNKDINKNNSIKNYSLKQCNTTYSNAIKKLQQKNNLQGRIIKTTNIACEFIITSDKDFFDAIGIDETKRYFQTAYDFVANYKNLGEKYIISAKVHMDESTPHLHLVLVPVIHNNCHSSSKKKISLLLLIFFLHLWHIFHFVNEDNTCFLYLLIANFNYTILSFIEKWANPAIVVIVVVVVVEVAVRVHIPHVVVRRAISGPKPEPQTTQRTGFYCIAL